VPITVADAEELERRCGSDAHQGVCAEVDPYSYADPDALLTAESRS
jgi:23S rRNA (guanosine2251-2'-O)-methyltransferase